MPFQFLFPEMRILPLAFCFESCPFWTSLRRGNWLPPFILLFKWEEKDFHALWSEFNGSQIIHFWASSLASFRSLAFISVSFSGRVYLAPIGTPWWGEFLWKRLTWKERYLASLPWVNGLIQFTSQSYQPLSLILKDWVSFLPSSGHV